MTGTFDFAYDWEFLHHIFPEDRETYIRNVHKILNPGATYFSVCFSEEDPQFGGTGKYRKTRIGTTLYFSSESEIRELVSPYFTIRELKTIEVGGKFGSALCSLSAGGAALNASDGICMGSDHILIEKVNFSSLAHPVARLLPYEDVSAVSSHHCPSMSARASEN